MPVDDGHRHAAGAIGRGEVAAVEQGLARRGEILRQNHAICGAVFLPGRRRRPSLDRVAEHPEIAGEREVVDGACSGDAGQRGDPFGHSLEEGHACFGGRLAGAVERDADGDEAIGYQAKIDVLQVNHGARKEDRRGGERKCQGDLGSDQHRAGTATRGATRDRAGWLQRARGGGPTHAPAGSKRRRDRRERCDTHRKRQYRGRDGNRRVRRQAVRGQRARKQRGPGGSARHATAGTGSCDDHPLHQRPSQEPCVGGAERRADCELRLPAGHSRDDQHRQVDRRDQQQPAGQTEDGQQQRADGPDGLLVEEHRACCEPCVGVGPVAREPRIDAVQFRARLVDGHVIA